MGSSRRGRTLAPPGRGRRSAAEPGLIMRPLDRAHRQSLPHFRPRRPAWAGAATDSAPDRLLCTRYLVSQHSRESRKVVTKYRGRVKPKPPVVRHIDLHTPNLPRPFAPQAPGPATGGSGFSKISQTAIVQCPLRHLQAVVAVRSAIHTVAPAASPAVPQSRFRASNDMSA